MAFSQWASVLHISIQLHQGLTKSKPKLIYFIYHRYCVVQLLMSIGRFFFGYFRFFISSSFGWNNKKFISISHLQNLHTHTHNIHDMMRVRCVPHHNRFTLSLDFAFVHESYWMLVIVLWLLKNITPSTHSSKRWWMKNEKEKMKNDKRNNKQWKICHIIWKRRQHEKWAIK